MIPCIFYGNKGYDFWGPLYSRGQKWLAIDFFFIYVLVLLTYLGRNVSHVLVYFNSLANRNSKEPKITCQASTVQWVTNVMILVPIEMDAGVMTVVAHCTFKLIGLMFGC